MKKFSIVILSFLMFSCSKDSKDSNNSPSGTISWSFKANGVQYQWSGSYPYSASYSTHTSGQSSYLVLPASTPTIELSSPYISSTAQSPNSLTFTLQNENLGLHILNGPGMSNGIYSVNSVDLTLNNQHYSTSSTSQINLNISQMASSTNGITKGTFSGTMMLTPYAYPTVINITEGSFEAVRIQ